MMKYRPERENEFKKMKFSWHQYTHAHKLHQKSQQLSCQWCTNQHFLMPDIHTFTKCEVTSTVFNYRSLFWLLMPLKKKTLVFFGGGIVFRHKAMSCEEKFKNCRQSWIKIQNQSCVFVYYTMFRKMQTLVEGVRLAFKNLSNFISSMQLIQ